METLVKTLSQDYPQFAFITGSKAHWSPATQTIFYSLENTESDTWALLHELGHALLGHTSYNTDIELLQKEAEAWHKATELASSYASTIAQDYIQDCLDTYRDWLHKRSSCPTCYSHGIQTTQRSYTCPNCQDTWEVSSARFCRPYRLKKA